MNEKHLSLKIKTLITLIVIMWVMLFVNFVIFNHNLLSYGITPRTLSGLRGIFFAPFLHANLVHLTSNTIPFFILGILAMHDGTGEFYTVFIVSMITAGIGTWITGRSGTVHIGASGIIFGLFGYLLLKGYFHRRALSIITSIVVALLYGGMIWGVLPKQTGISWQSHLFGFIGGALCAKAMSKRVYIKVDN
ncbi:MAG: rhomboid family intramembrane serine protease [Spirochaetes bacterium]|jgi:membrane associated rhomboid family serine protease|nr:rhomboid family intramembrane serine protease [Spirochaetota bacterium]